MRIGYVNPDYPAKRNIIGKAHGVDYVRVRSFKSLMDKIKKSAGLISGLQPYWFCGGVPEGFKHVDLFHFFNDIALWPSRKPFVTTFECELPRKFPEGTFLKHGFNAMASNRCKKLIAISERAKEVTACFAKRNGFPEIIEKISVIHPPQEILVTESELKMRENHTGGVIKLLFIGRDFFGKGGGELVRAAVELHKNFQFELTLVGDPFREGFAFYPEIDDASSIMKIVENNPWIHLHPSLPYAAVLSMIKTCDIGVLPTRSDTYGYSVLEFQSAGLPCVTTSIDALPEINDEKCGWLLDVPAGDYNSPNSSTSESRHELSRCIEKGLVEVLSKALTNIDVVRRKGIESIERIRKYHSPEVYGQKMRSIYNEALS